MKHRKTILSVAAVLLTFVLLLSLATKLLQPKYMEDLVEGSMLSQYYREAGNHDVIFLGDCEVYANIIPMELYREAGITAYVRGSSQQLLWQSYYILKETFRYEIPKMVVFNVNAMRYDAPVSEAYNRLSLDKMKWSEEKVDMILASMTEEENFLSYVFPILRYHSRFDELTGEDLRYLFTVRDNTFNGHLVNQSVKPVGTLPTKRVLANYQFADICYDYLDQIRLLCQENGVELVLMKAPSVYPYWYEEYDAQIQAYADAYGLKFYNFLDHVEQIGIDYQTDTYDGGLHLNSAGAAKLSRFFANILSQEHGLPDHRETAIWALNMMKNWRATMKCSNLERRNDMKRWMAFLAALLLILSLAACQQPETADQPEDTQTQLQNTEPTEPFAFQTGGMSLIPGETFDAAKLPEAASVYQVPSCAVEGTDNVYNYEDFEVTAFQDGSGEYIYSIYFITPNITTPEGLALGDDAQKATKCYGADYQVDGSAWVYTRQETVLSVIIQNDSVIGIEYRMVTQ